MLPKKIYLNYVNKDDVDKTWSEEPISTSDCVMNNREYTDLSQVWHNTTEIPDTSHDRILVLHEHPSEKPFIWAIDPFNWIVAHNGDWDEYVKANHIISWAYNTDLLPKGGEVWK